HHIKGAVMINLQDISTSVQAGDTKKTEKLVVQALHENYPPGDILKQGLAASMIEMAKRFAKMKFMTRKSLPLNWQ
ncbi:MAG: B12-binding domain-containing protein, partial [Treponema sp.]|nr:B12-binding domain-containing protein [Treponema sp.]